MSDTGLIDSIASFAERRVLVVGDVMLDEYIWGDVRRISPEAPVPVVEHTGRSVRAGGAANAAANVASLGGVVSLGGAVGSDAYAGELRQALQQQGVGDFWLVADPARPTTTKTRIVAHNQHLVRIDRECHAELPRPLEEELVAWAADRLQTVGACVISDYAKGVISARLVQRLIKLGREAQVPIVVDPKGGDFAKYRGATVITPNTHEAEQAVSHRLKDEASLRQGALELQGLLDGASVLITRGEEGMTLFERGANPHHIPTAARSVYDVTGAGDTVAGALALGLAAGLSLADAALVANRAAGVVVGKVGTASVSLAELLEAYSRPAHS